MPKRDPAFFSQLSATRWQKRLYDQASALAHFGAWECDLSTEELSWTEGVYRIFGLSLETRLRRAAVLDHYFDESRQEMEHLRRELIQTGQGFVIESRIRTLDGRSRWMRLMADIAYEDGRPVRLFGSKQDITEQREVLDHFRALAERDPLTGLANRAVFESRYRRIVMDRLNYGSAAALVLIDLDRFKQLNDTFGHLAGDECLRRVADRLRELFFDALLVARIGGDEFAVILGAPLGPTRIARMLSRAFKGLTRPMLWNGFRLDVGVSIGACVIGRPHPRPLADLFAEADAALYAAKSGKGGGIRIFGEEAGADDWAVTPFPKMSRSSAGS